MTCSGNDLVSDNTKHLPEPILTQHQSASIQGNFTGNDEDMKY